MDLERTLAPSPFPGDDGAADPAARRALAAAVRDVGTETYLRAVAALCATRVLVPVVATATRTSTTASARGLSSDKEADMSVVMLQAGDGSRALLGFTGLDALTTWRPDARPVPVTLDLAARTARAEGVGTVLVDVAGPHPLAIDGEVLDALAQGHRLVEVEPGEFGWAVPVQEVDDEPHEQPAAQQGPARHG